MWNIIIHSKPIGVVHIYNWNETQFEPILFFEKKQFAVLWRVLNAYSYSTVPYYCYRYIYFHFSRFFCSFDLHAVALGAQFYDGRFQEENVNGILSQKLSNCHFRCAMWRSLCRGSSERENVPTLTVTKQASASKHEVDIYRWKTSNLMCWLYNWVGIIISAAIAPIEAILSKNNYISLMEHWILLFGNTKNK